MKNPGFNPHNRSKHQQCSPRTVLAEARKDPTDRVAVLAARCVQCVGEDQEDAAELVRGCPRKTCVSWKLRPWQRDVPPRSAPHCSRLPPTYEREPQEEAGE